jgi:chromosome segregation ATPase
MSYSLHIEKSRGLIMSRIGITFGEVKEAIAVLQGKQKNPTVDNIREVLGTGSKSTIARFLREWKAQHGLHSSDDGRLPSDLLGIVNGLWEALRSKAEGQADKYCEESDTKLADIQQQLIQARQLETSQRQNLHTLEEELHQQKERSRLLESKLITEEQEKIRITERAAAHESRRQEHHAENQRLHQLLKHVQENLEHYQAATQKLREDQLLLIEKHQNEYEQKLSQLLAQANAAISEKAVVQAQHEQLTKVYNSQITEHKTLATQYMEVQRQSESLKITHEKIQHEHDTLNKQCHAQTIELASLQRTVMELQFNIRPKDEKIVSLEDGLTKANDKIETLRHEYQFALQEKAVLAGQLKQMQSMMSSGKVRAVS